jgi:YjbE family integral membrane protein
MASAATCRAAKIFCVSLIYARTERPPTFHRAAKSIYPVLSLPFLAAKAMRPFGPPFEGSTGQGQGAERSMIVDQPGFWLAVLQIIWIDILLSGDNAVVIALACRKLPARQRLWGVVLGTLVAISLRVVFAGLVTTLMQMAYLKLVGGALLLWIAVKLLGPEENGKNDTVEAVDSLWRAVRIIAIADLVMSLDNVVAIAAVAERFEAPQSYALLMFGLAVSIPLIMAGAAIVMSLLERFPIIVWAGAALLGWIAGEIIAKDPVFTANLDPQSAHTVWMVGATLGALFVVCAGLVRRRLLRRSAADQV